ncbi:CRISPR-associated endonuclease Cas2 [Desulforhopalus singaporensis]|uniref:CRISPR-associated endonuclease Cas2 n=1 Tax=Desulforhopalus singaporensis TaxID=91360 RepID=UPI000B89E11C|nr:CRISPR-associated endonuclease Cas2 [Desulforhopalus singaporensis]
MALYFLTYDLRNSKDYQKLYSILENFNAVRILESTWCFNRVNTSAKGLRDYFKKFIDEDDGLIISEVTNWASYKVDGSPNDLK